MPVCAQYNAQAAEGNERMSGSDLLEAHLPGRLQPWDSAQITGEAM
jgi:hypothetical protein